MEKYKITLIGQSNVGKSSLMMRFRKGEIDQSCVSTIGAAFHCEKIWIPEEEVYVNLEIWDTAGQERFNSIVPMYFKNAKAIILVYDVTHPETAQALKTRWSDLLKDKFTKKQPVIFIVGNKIDLLEKDITDDIIIVMRNLVGFFGPDCVTYFTSAMTGENVVQLFEGLATHLHNTFQDSLSQSMLHLHKETVIAKTPSKRKCCS